MPAKTIYFSKARTALKYGLQALELNDQDIILVPDFVCDSIFQPIQQNSLNFSTYELEDDLSPNWSSLDLIITKKIKAIVMIHYFGQPQDVNKFIGFCKKHNIFLIEDNAHGHSGLINGRELGTFGDIGISSPRKFQGNGGVLYLNRDYKESILPALPNEEPKASSSGLKFLLNKIPKFKHLIKRAIKKRPKYEDPRAFREPFIDDFYLSKESADAEELRNWSDIRDLRRKKFDTLQNIALNGGLKPIFSKVHNESNPWCFAAYAESQEEAIQWFDWGWQNNVEVFSWPPLREEQITSNNKAFLRWQRVVCFSTDC